MKNTTASFTLTRLIEESERLTSMVEEATNKREIAMLAEFGGSLSSLADTLLDAEQSYQFYLNFMHFTQALVDKQNSL